MNEINKRLFFNITFIFLISNLFGVFIGMTLHELEEDVETVKRIGSSLPFERESALNSIFLMGYILFAAGLMIVFIKIIKYLKKIVDVEKMSFITFESLLIFSSSLIVFLSILLFFNFDEKMSLFFSFLLSFFLVFLKFISTTYNLNIPHIKNICAIISVSGVGAIFGFNFSLFSALLFCALLSLYDYISVFITKHMVFFANELSKQDLAFMVSTKIENKNEKLNHKENEMIKKIDIGKTQKYYENKLENVERKNKARMDLGTGDLVIPIAISVSSYASFGIFSSFAIIVGGYFGLLILFSISKEKRILPALPAICFGVSLALFSFLFFKNILYFLLF